MGFKDNANIGIYTTINLCLAEEFYMVATIEGVWLIDRNTGTFKIRLDKSFLPLLEKAVKIMEGGGK